MSGCLGKHQDPTQPDWWWLSGSIQSTCPYYNRGPKRNYNWFLWSIKHMNIEFATICSFISNNLGTADEPRCDRDSSCCIVEWNDIRAQVQTSRGYMDLQALYAMRSLVEGISPLGVLIPSTGWNVNQILLKFYPLKYRRWRVLICWRFLKCKLINIVFIEYIYIYIYFIKWVNLLKDISLHYCIALLYLLVSLLTVSVDMFIIYIYIVLLYTWPS